MMTMSKATKVAPVGNLNGPITQVFPHDIKPAHEGVYRTSFALSCNKRVRGYSYWNGTRWGMQRGTPGGAFSGRNNTWGASQDKAWRGLAEPA